VITDNLCQAKTLPRDIEALMEILTPY